MKDLTIPTMYGEVRAAILERLENSFDTRQLLTAIDELDTFCIQWKGELRSDLLRVHRMAHTVVNGSALTEPPGPETLPELAHSLHDALRALQAALTRTLPALGQLAELAPD